MDEAKTYILVHGTIVHGTFYIILRYMYRQFTAHSPRHLQKSQHALSVLEKGNKLQVANSDKVGVTLKTKPKKEGKRKREREGTVEWDGNKKL